ncbi:MAG TPA: alkaline phosphatase family protein [Tepidisphaeraceae bacterium]|jgi:hypothetical protein|nr:alkaline phosphatase family protein [Tepidisphaeraceae bacterium]
MLHPRIFITILLAFCSSLLAQTTEPAKSRPATRPIPAIEHILVISIDGGRPDLLLRANCPTIRAMMANGSYSFWAKTTAVALTLPSHVSMMTGATPVHHGIHWNEDLPFSKPYYPKVPTLFELAHKSGYTTALISGKAKFDIFQKPGALDWTYLPGIQDAEALAALPMEKQSTKASTASDATLVSEANSIFSKHHPDVVLLHFASSDVAGHAFGWGSPAQMLAFESIDSSIGQILKSLDPTYRDHLAIILTADHGGAGRTHGADDPRSRHIPWILSGPGIRKNFDLTSLPDLDINTYDTFSTACYLLNIPVHYKTDGKPILDALENRQLLH